MELTHRAHKESMFAPEDVISSMPDNVLTNVMDRLPIRDAVRTSILSGNWRFKWTMLSRLVFDEKFFMYLPVTKGEKNHGGVISRILLQLSGTITKFELSRCEFSCSVLDVHDIAHWISFLSKKGLTDLTLWMKHREHVPPFKLPIHFFSCLELKHLKLCGCHFDPPLTFHGFPNLLSLELRMVKSESRKFRQFISRCPALEILKMGYTYDYFLQRGMLKLLDIAKLANLKILSLELFTLCHMEIESSNRIFELVGFFPQLEELRLDFIFSMLTKGGNAEKALPTTFPRLKILKLLRVDLGKDIMLSCVIEMIRRSLDLHTLEISTIEPVTIPTQHPPPATRYNTMGLLQLRSVFFKDASENKNEVRLIEYVLACSPFLRKIEIRSRSHLSFDKKFMLAKKLLELERASPKAKVYIY